MPAPHPGLAGQEEAAEPGVRDLYRLTAEVFSHPGYVAFYLVGMAIVGSFSERLYRILERLAQVTVQFVVFAKVEDYP